MMDVDFNNRRFPYAWRSSLAISAFEPAADDLPSGLCGQKITFIKVTCSLTGYHSEVGEGAGDIEFGDEPLEELERLTSEYLGCYGALLNVAFFPLSLQMTEPGRQVDLNTFPRIMDFSPKSRELISSITESGESLTGSSRSLAIDQSHTTTRKSESTVGVEASVEAGVGGGGGNEEGGARASAGAKAKATLSHTWGTTDEEKEGLNIGSGSTQTNRRGYATQMDQLYSLLTGYHTGTNRATFIMLARPGTVQPTNRRTFAQGLRMLEGVQDFIFIISAPSEQEGLCIEASLNTGHFPEDVRQAGETAGEQDHYEHKIFTFIVHARARGGGNAFEGGDQFEFGSETRPQDIFTLPSDEHGQWVLDTEAPGTERGIEFIEDRSGTDPEVTDGIIADYYHVSVIPIGDTQVQARGKVDARGGNSDRGRIDTIIEVEYQIHAKRFNESKAEAPVDVDQMLVTGRNLSVCYRSVEGCPQIVESPQLEIPEDNAFPGVKWLENKAMRNRGGSRSQDQLYAVMRSALISGAAAGSKMRKPVKFTETDYFSRKVAMLTPSEDSKIPLVKAVAKKNYDKKEIVAIGNLSLGQILSSGLKDLARKTRLSEDLLRRLRRDALSYVNGKVMN